MYFLSKKVDWLINKRPCNSLVLTSTIVTVTLLVKIVLLQLYKSEFDRLLHIIGINRYPAPYILIVKFTPYIDYLFSHTGSSTCTQFDFFFF